MLQARLSSNCLQSSPGAIHHTPGSLPFNILSVGIQLEHTGARGGPLEQGLEAVVSHLT